MIVFICRKISRASYVPDDLLSMNDEDQDINLTDNLEKQTERFIYC